MHARCWLLHLAFVSNQVFLDAISSSFDDSVFYNINWPGVDENSVDRQLQQDAESKFDELIVQSNKNEKFKCRIPKPVEKEKDSTDKNAGPNPVDLLSELFSYSSCSYRFEAYWTYQVCHGQFVRQYHEEREGKKVKLQEYFLGRWDKAQQEKLKQALEEEMTKRPSYAVPMKKVDGANMPYVQVNMTDGTFCELNGKPRQANVIYVCYAFGKHDIYSLKETSTCQYEIIVLSPLLCEHPKYRPKGLGENAIDCVPVDGTRAKPKALQQMEMESLKLRQSKDSSARVRVEILPLGAAAGNVLGATESSAQSIPVLPLESFSHVDDGFTDFITGRDCIQGGSGWWRYEFCYGKSVTQFHSEKAGKKTTINLGNFIKSAHLKWLAEHPHKKPVPGSHLSYLYTKGSICPETGKHREVEVKLKCVEGRSPGALSVYLLEPRTCQYILGVESQLVCRLLSHVDEDGLIDREDFVGFSRADFSSGYQPREEQPKSKRKTEPTKITLIFAEDGNIENIPHE